LVGAGEAWNAMRGAHTDIQMMFWGERLGLEDACARIGAWVAAELW
jgi:hypothetical protein